MTIQGWQAGLHFDCLEHRIGYAVHRIAVYHTAVQCVAWDAEAAFGSFHSTVAYRMPTMWICQEMSRESKTHKRKKSTTLSILVSIQLILERVSWLSKDVFHKHGRQELKNLPSTYRPSKSLALDFQAVLQLSVSLLWISFKQFTSIRSGCSSFLF